MVNAVLGMGGTAGYALGKRGEYLVRLLPGGRGYRVSRCDLYRHLGVTGLGGRATDKHRQAEQPGLAAVYDQPCSVSAPVPPR